MKIAQIFIALVTVTTLAMVGSVFAGDFYVVQDQLGQATVMEGHPGLGWTIAGGPYKSKDEAERALGAAGAVKPTAPPTRSGAAATTGQFYVVRDNQGQAAVLQGEPGPGWAVQSGPYASEDAARRALGSAQKPTAMPVAPAGAGEKMGSLYIVKDKLGQTTVSEGMPGIGWSVVEGPFKTKDAAERAMGPAAEPTARP